MYTLPLSRPFLFRQYLHLISSLIKSTICLSMITNKHSRVFHLLRLTWVRLMSNVLKTYNTILGNTHMSNILKGAKWITHYPVERSSISYRWWGTNIIPTHGGMSYLCHICIRSSTSSSLGIFSIWCISLVYWCIHPFITFIFGTRYLRYWGYRDSDNGHKPLWIQGGGWA